MNIHSNANEPRIQDVETAKETSRLASNQALNQAGAAVLAQADHLSKLVLKLVQ